MSGEWVAYSADPATLRHVIDTKGTRVVFLGRLAVFPSALMAAAAGASGMDVAAFSSLTPPAQSSRSQRSQLQVTCSARRTNRPTGGSPPSPPPSHWGYSCFSAVGFAGLETLSPVPTRSRAGPPVAGGSKYPLGGRGSR